jgi:hypothetical protein
MSFADTPAGDLSGLALQEELDRQVQEMAEEPRARDQAHPGLDPQHVVPLQRGEPAG